MDIKDLYYIESLKSENSGLRWSFRILWEDYVKLNNKYRRKKLNARLDR